MISRKTVLILGAGASYPYGFPLGSQLVQSLLKHPTYYKVNHPGYAEHGKEILLHKDFEYNYLEEFRRVLDGAALDSIDAFLTARPEYAEVGKAAIAAALVPKENLSRIEPGDVRGGDWYRYLRNQMGESYHEFAASAMSLSIVTFNNDRSFEYFFWNALSATYGESRAFDVMKRLRIVHVYGQLGKPDFLNDNGRPYSPSLNREVVAKCVEEIRIIPENRDGSEEFREAVNLIEDAKVICFLGFGYNQANIRRLRLKTPFLGDVFGTTIGMEPNEVALANERLRIDLFQNVMRDCKFGNKNEDSLLFLRTYPVLM